MKASVVPTAPDPSPAPASATAATRDGNPGNGARSFSLQNTLPSYEVEELSGWQLAAILADLPRVVGAEEPPLAAALED